MSETVVTTIVSGLITVMTMVIGFLTMWVKLKYGEQKIDDNTRLTKEGTAAAARNAKVAADTASEAREAAQNANNKLNGGIDDAIKAAVEPVHLALMQHISQDDRDIAEIKSKIDQVTSYVHERNHDLIQILNMHSLKMDSVLINQKAAQQIAQQTPQQEKSS